MTYRERGDGVRGSGLEASSVTPAEKAEMLRYQPFGSATPTRTPRRDPRRDAASSPPPSPTPPPTPPVDSTRSMASRFALRLRRCVE